MSARFGLTPTDFELFEKLVVKPVIVRNGTIFIFGSRVTGKYHPFSDLDVLLREDPRNPFNTKFLSDLNESLEESMMTIKVDLVLENNLTSSYRESVFRDMKKW